MTPSKSLTMGNILFFSAALMLSGYFAFAAVKGTYGVLRRAEVLEQNRTTQIELDAVQAEVARMRNLTRRLSDSYLDLDLLEERARDTLGLMRLDEIVIP